MQDEEAKKVSDKKILDQRRREWVARQLKNILCKKCEKRDRAPGSSRCSVCTDEYRKSLQAKV